MSNNKKSLIILTLIGIVSLACNLPFGLGSANPTSIAQTFIAELTETAQAAPTQTNTPSSAPTSAAATAIPLPSATIAPVSGSRCNWAEFVTDLNYPDNTGVTTGQVFTKTWRLKNIGSCNWVGGYQLVFVSGDQMNAAASTPLPGGIVAPGGTVDVSVTLKAPDAAGTYQGFFRLRSADGQEFGIGGSAGEAFWVRIIATAPGAPPPPTNTATATSTSGGGPIIPPILITIPPFITLAPTPFPIITIKPPIFIPPLIPPLPPGP